MFTDTHFHLGHLSSLGIDLPELFKQLVNNDFCFVQDIGTKCDDLEKRISIAKDACSSIPDRKIADSAWEMTYFTAGIWPDAESIKNRFAVMSELKSRVFKILGDQVLAKKLTAIGECGIDHHWNASGVDHRSEDDFSSDVLTGERELFESQLEFARSVKLPVIIHSRESFDDTLDCMKNCGYHKGVVHCFSYGKKEAEKFLNLGWYIALGGAVTYTKKSRQEEMFDLIRYIPRDRLLLETDAPYLAPVPYRGKTNTPLLILETYNFICQALGIDLETLSLLAENNARNLFLSKC